MSHVKQPLFQFFLPTILFTFSTAFVGSIVLAETPCTNLLAEPFAPKWSPTPIQIIYLPQTEHVKLRVGEDVYANEWLGERCTHQKIKSFNRLPNFGGRGLQLRFHIKARPSEVLAMETFMSEGRFSDNFILGCAYSVCYTVNQTTKAWIPAPLSFTPFLMAAYLVASRLTPGTRVNGLTLILPRILGREKTELRDWEIIAYALGARRNK